MISTDPRNCEKCGFEAEDLYQYDAHTWEVHDEDSLECKFCDEAFENKGDLMSHNKEEHKENLAICQHYSAGNLGSLTVKNCHNPTNNPKQLKTTFVGVVL